MDFGFTGVATRDASESGAWLNLTRDDGKALLDHKGEPVGILLMGPDSDAYRALSWRHIRDRVAQASAGQGDTDYVTENMKVIEILVACTKDWRNVRTTEGKAIPFTADAARALFVAYPGIRDQVDSFVAARRNFTGASAKH